MYILITFSGIKIISRVMPSYVIVKPHYEKDIFVMAEVLITRYPISVSYLLSYTLK